MTSVFLSYSHKDEVWKDRLKTHLGVLDLDTWDDRRIEGGSDWFEDIQEAMARASVAVFLVSADFLTSEFIRGEEVPKLLERRTREGLPVIPVIARSCAWDEVKWLRRIQARPKDGRALASFEGDHTDQELTKIAKEIRTLLDRKPEARDTDRGRELRSPTGDFLDRVETICRLREPEAEIHRFPGIGDAGGYLRIVRKIGEVRDIHPVGAIEHGLSLESLQAFLAEIDAPYRKNDPGLASVLVYGGRPAPLDLVAAARARRVHLVGFAEYQRLIDFRAYLKHQTTKLATDPAYPPHLYVPQQLRTLDFLSSEDGETGDALAVIKEWLVSPQVRFLVLLGDFGTGKTFLLHELARRMARGGLVPILLQLRSLEKSRSLDALLAQHFAQEGMEVFSPAKFRYMLEQGRIALLFDGFDELALRVTYAKAADHFTTLLQAAAGNAKVVLTCRRQHFVSESQVKTALAERVESLAGHRLAILQPFRREQVRHFLVNFFAGDEKKAKARLGLLDRVKDLLGLSAIPRLLGFIADLPEEQLLAACAEGGEITAARLYELLLERWLVAEFDRIHPQGAPPGLSMEARWHAVTLLALRLWQMSERFVSLSELNEEAARVVQAVGPAAPDPGVATFQIGSGTLLVRDDEGNFAFLHPSIPEWLVAKSAAEALATGASPEALAAREISPLMADFFASLAGRERAITWARNALTAPVDVTIKRNALLILARQKEDIQAKLGLAGQNLRGQDFSGLDLASADLSGADLSEARLVGTRLANARLVKATLRDTDLGTAVLTLADLSQADLTGSRLLGSDLQGARCTGTLLRRAKLLGATLDAGNLRSADVFGAALNLSDLGPQSSMTGSSTVTWSRDGELLASTEGSVIRFWEAQSGREIRAFAGHLGSINSVAFSPDDKTLASGSTDSTARLWQVDSGRQIGVFTGHQGSVKSVAFSPNGETLASGCWDDKTICIWQVDNGRRIKVLAGHEGSVESVAFSPDGKTLASSAYLDYPRLWHVDSGRMIRVFSAPAGWGSARSVAFSPDGKTLAGAFPNGIYLWHVDSGREVGAFSEQSLERVVFSPDGKIIVGVPFFKPICLWQVSNGKKIRVFGKTQTWVRSVAFSPDGKTLASASSDSIHLWQVDSGKESRVFAEQHQGSVWSVASSPDGKYLACASGTTVRLWQVGSGRESRAFAGHQKGVTSVVFSPNGTTLASASYDNTVRLWQTDSGRESRVLSGHQKEVRSVAFSPDGKTLASASADNTVRLWQVDSGRESRILSGHQKEVRSAAFSPNGTILASASADNTVRLWQVESGKEMRVLSGHQREVSSVAFNPNGTTLASASNDDTIRLWQVDSGRESRILSGHLSGVVSVAFSPDGEGLASCSHDSTVRLWQMDSGRERRIFAGHRSSVVSVVFSPGGNFLASGSWDGTIRLWNVVDGRCLAILLPLPEGWVAFSPDGRYKFGGVPAGGFWHAANLCRFEIGELDDWVPGLRLADDASFFDLPPWKPEIRVPERIAKARDGR